MTLPSLEGLRAVAVVFVFANHALLLPVFSDPSAHSVFNTLTGNGRVGFLAVSVFFVLSGFVLTWSAKPGRRTVDFWRRRLMRIGPSHVLIAVVALGQFAAAGDTIRWVPAIAGVLLVQTWWPDQDVMLYQFNGPSWTLSVDLLCYALFPLLIRFVRRLDHRALWPWLLGLGVTAALLPVISQPLLSGYPPSFYPAGSWPQMWALCFFPPVRTMEFVMGMLLARIVAEGRWPRIRVLPAVLLNLAVFLLLAHLPAVFMVAALYPVPAALLIGALAAGDRSGRRSILDTRFMMWLGELSFAFYIVHITVIFAAHAAFSGQLVGYMGRYTPTTFSTPVAVLFILGLYVLCLAVAWVLHRTVEVPAMRRWGSPKARPAPGRPHPERRLRT
ncbi:acyltransferase family protein [Kitasatospora sp. NPDC058444]|uniref:acyltransferase family protein n=1 Tax=Kitasatospora sp. NPDC058444 TaxID=3346504 RepID=UPI00365A041E